MTSLVVWVGVDQRRPASIYIATDSRISWALNDQVSHTFDIGKKIWASASFPVVIGFTGDVMFPAIEVPNIIERLDKQAALPDPVGFVERALRHAWHRYPVPERRALSIVMAHRMHQEMRSEFALTVLRWSPGSAAWTRSDIPAPISSSAIHFGGSGSARVEYEILRWETSTASGTSRAVFGAFTDALGSGVDPRTGGAPQLGGIYRIGHGRLFGVVHENQRYFAGSPLIGAETLPDVEWRNRLFERVDSATKSRLAEAQPHRDWHTAATDS